jgi:anti-sigma factor RsiW
MAELSDQDREDLTAYLDGELDEDKARQVEAKLNLDPKARAEAEAMRQAWGLLDYLPKVEPSSSFTNRTMERLALQRPVDTGKMPRQVGKNPWVAGLGWAAAVLAAAGLGWGVAAWFWPTNPEALRLDDQLVRHLRLIERLRQYEQVESLDFLKALDHPDLFGEDHGS